MHKFFHQFRFRFGSLSHSICIVQESVSVSESESESGGGNKPLQRTLLSDIVGGSCCYRSGFNRSWCLSLNVCVLGIDTKSNDPDFLAEAAPGPGMGRGICRCENSCAHSKTLLFNFYMLFGVLQYTCKI